MAYGAERGLQIADKLTGQPTLAGYVKLPAVRGYLLAKLGRLEEACQEFNRAAELTSNESERTMFRAQAARPMPPRRARMIPPGEHPAGPRSARPGALH